MKNLSVFFLIAFIIFSFGFVSFIGCSGDDDDDTSQPTATPTQGTDDTPTPTTTPQEGDTPTPTPTITPTPEPGTGTLNIWTTNASGDIYVNGNWMGNSSWIGDVEPGDYLVSFGDVSGYDTPVDVWATVVEGETTHVEGIYTETSNSCYFTDVRVDGVPYTGNRISVAQSNSVVVTFTLVDGVSWTAWDDNSNYVDPTSGGTTGSITWGALNLGNSTLHIDGVGSGGNCSQLIYFNVY